MTYDTFIGPITQISFTEFLALVPELVLEDGTQSHRFVTKVTDWSCDIPDDAEFPYTSESPHEQREIWLLPETFGSELIALQNLTMQAGVRHLYNESMEELVTEMAVTQAERFGLPTHLVSVENRWLMANPKDFLKFRSDKGVGLACLNSYRTILYTLFEAHKRSLEDV